MCKNYLLRLRIFSKMFEIEKEVGNCHIIWKKDFREHISVIYLNNEGNNTNKTTNHYFYNILKLVLKRFNKISIDAIKFIKICVKFI